MISIDTYTQYDGCWTATSNKYELTIETNQLLIISTSFCLWSIVRNNSICLFYSKYYNSIQSNINVSFDFTTNIIMHYVLNIFLIFAESWLCFVQVCYIRCCSILDKQDTFQFYCQSMVLNFNANFACQKWEDV